VKVTLNKKILEKNEECALQNKAFFAEYKTLCLNVISSPGSGKTTIISRTILDAKDKVKIGVIEGDIKTDTDAAKIRETGAPAVQIETSGACHLSAQQITGKLGAISAGELDILFIENVGNLVCPSDFDLGEQGRVVVLSVPEGDDKPAKYPGTFAKADVLLINKIDLLDHVDFDVDKVITDAGKLNPDLKIFQVSAKTGAGMNQWYDWLLGRISS
jgi:hydrogenase nickel incorporation protein HypB